MPPHMTRHPSTPSASHKLLVTLCMTLAVACLLLLFQLQTAGRASAALANQFTNIQPAAASHPTDDDPSPFVATRAQARAADSRNQGTAATAVRRITAEEKSTTDLFRQTSPSVVHITTEAVRRNFFSLDLLKIPQGSGSGFVWDDKGHIVTNYHVIREADFAHVALADQSTWPAELVGAAPDKDLAVLRIKAPARQLKPVHTGQSNNLEVGLKVFAIGNPFGLDQTLTTGIISALGREIESVTRRPIRDVIQTDAAINPGNSGGPLLDSQGSLIGVNTAIFSPSGAYAGIGFAIPVDTVRRVVPQLIEHGKLIRPGLRIELAPDGLSRRLRLEGVIILNMDAGSTAEKAGLTPTTRNRQGEVFIGDVITAVNDTPIRTGDDLWLAFEEFEIGSTVKLSILHEGEPKTVDVQLEAID